MGLTNFDISLLIFYVIICIGIGFWSSRKQKESDYLIAGRKLTTWSFIATLIASYVGGGAIVAYTAYVYRFGISAVSLYLGTALSYLIFIWYALRIRAKAKEKNFHTLSDWFSHKFDKKVAVLSAIIIFIAYFGSLVNQFIAGTSILSSIGGWSYESALLSSGIVIIIYLILGGFRSVVKTDVFQYLVLVVLFVVLGSFMVKKSGGVSPELLDPAGLGIGLTITFIIYGIFNIFSSPDVWQRVYAAKSDAVVKKGFIGGAIAIVIVGFLVSLIGLAAATHAPGLDPNQAAAYGLQSLLPPALLTLGLVLVFAAIMSSADTIIFILASSAAKDYSFSRHVSERRLMKLTRIAIVVISLLGIFFAYFFRDLIAVAITIAGLVLVLVPPIVGSFHWKIKSGAAFAALLGGLLYIIGIVLAGYIIPEAAIASIFVSFILLLIFQKVLKK